MKELTRNYIKELRQNTTDAEKHLWYFLRAKRLKGYKFRRQHLVSPFVLDFVCLEKKLVIELDGGHHAIQQDYDEKHTSFLRSKGFTVLRFWNNDILENTEFVLRAPLEIPFYRINASQFVHPFPQRGKVGMGEK